MLANRKFLVNNAKVPETCFSIIEAFDKSGEWTFFKNKDGYKYYDISKNICIWFTQI